VIGQDNFVDKAGCVVGCETGISRCEHGFGALGMQPAQDIAGGGNERDAMGETR